MIAIEVCNHCVPFVLCRRQSVAYVVELLWFSFGSQDRCHCVLLFADEIFRTTV